MARNTLLLDIQHQLVNQLKAGPLIPLIQIALLMLLLLNKPHQVDTSHTRLKPGPLKTEALPIESLRDRKSVV